MARETTNASARERFGALFDHVAGGLRGDERATASYVGERSDFIRFNGGRVRQPGSVEQAEISLRLIDGARHASAGVALSGDLDADRAGLDAAVASLRDLLPHLPDDPHLLVNDDASQSAVDNPGAPPEPGQVIDAVAAAGDSGLDWVGIYAGGDMRRGFASSWGHRNWFSTRSFNLDWCLVRDADKAVKCNYAGVSWDGDALAAKVDRAREDLAVLSRPARTISPGAYRVYLSPSAVEELLSMFCWGGGLGLKSRETRTTPMLPMLEGKALDPRVTLSEYTAAGVSPDFQSDGYRKPDRVTLIRDGQLGDPLISPRSAREYGVESNGADGNESPSSVDLAAGEMPLADALERLDTGLWVGNLWYLNFSDHSACRVTGMTRFATFWVEGGEIVAPVNVMRFDEGLFDVFGDKLEALTAEREMLLSSSTYFQRSTISSRLPGALVRDFTFTL